MIERISLAGVATFHGTTAEVLDSLPKFNYIFGSNGTGKTCALSPDDSDSKGLSKND